ncbi:hypothetical protein DTO166G4_3357 [Paecilomyces variotii]|nr:hypothetical protein DTO032I3_4662 [Paecilomyces variotii]KAJ9202623.1 hypothetical protein DTO164E3_3063 [Paecilomyces variotii]KAJ9215100.1 hypothetical protein DTO166G4_3357 [Paecilomyces variotii]KAJ9224494.1 hypothetical protein DTO169C6_3043 [Paecilomyces variotii]KAJ9239058.1 hypothetical protein DTO166G5_2588 [Paecilomyces variotii]
MTIHTLSLGAAVAPTVVSTFISHYLHRKSLRHKPTHHLSYDEALHVLREFLRYASYHTVEDLQAFTNQSIPSPHWVRSEVVTIPEEYLATAAKTVIDELGPKGVKRVGGEKWWQWRLPGQDLKAEWIEVRGDYNENKASGAHCKRVMLYVHGGAYFFGGMETHRYQMQRHARKLKARVFARYGPGTQFMIRSIYRLSPQFPFPCALHDCLAAYLYLLSIHDPTEIILAGDSAGGGMVVSMLVTIRDRGIPLPAGVKDNPGDYIPPYGFMQKPSAAWPPPNADDMLAIEQGAHDQIAKSKGLEPATSNDNRESHEAHVHGYTVRQTNLSEEQKAAHFAYPGHQDEVPPSEEPQAPVKPADNLRVIVDDKELEIKDQIQMYTTNQLISHPLVSPVLQPSLGGLPPLLILTGGGEMLRDEQIYLAHKAADPKKYPPNDVYLNEYDPNREILNKYAPTFVQLQVWDGLCHVAPTLSFTRPAKYMFRSIAQFGAWALARAQRTEIDILDDDDVSVISTSGTDTDDHNTDHSERKGTNTMPSSVGRAGDPLPPFHHHMIRQRVDTKAHIYPLDPPESLEALQQPPEKVGAINPDVVKKWIAAKKEWDHKFAKEKLKVQSARIKELAAGIERFDGETPPPSALAGRRSALLGTSKRRHRRSPLVMMWNAWSTKHDERTLRREIRAGQADQTANIGITGGDAPTVLAATTSRRRSKSLQKRDAASLSSAGRSRSVSRRRAVSDTGQASISGESSIPTTITQNGADGGIVAATSAGATDTTSLQPPVSDSHISASYILTDVDAGDSRSVITDDNTSTKTLRNARGVAPLIRGSSLRAEYRPPSAAGSQGPTLTVTSDMGESMSIVSDGFAPSLDGDRGPDPNASTIAIIGAPGVIGQKAKRQSGLSHEVHSIYRQESDNTGQSGPLTDGLEPDHSRMSASVRSINCASGVVSPIGDEGKGIEQSSNETRPAMPERDEFTTAPEIPLSQ